MYEEAASAFTETGELSTEAIQRATKIIDPGAIGNPAIPEGFAKYTVALEGYKHASLRRSYTAATWKLADSAAVSREWITTALLHLVRNVRDTNFEVTTSVPLRAGMEGAELTATIKDQRCGIRVYVSNDFAVQLTACSKKEEPQLHGFPDSLRPEAGSSK